MRGSALLSGVTRNDCRAQTVLEAFRVAHWDAYFQEPPAQMAMGATTNANGKQ
jgi:hypothetical protein